MQSKQIRFLFSVVKATRLSMIFCLSIICNISLSIIYNHQLAFTIIQFTNCSSVLIDSAGYGMSTGVAKRVTISSEMEILATLVVNVNDSSKYRIEKSKQGFFLACGKCNIFSKDFPVLLKMTFSAAKERIRGKRKNPQLRMQWKCCTARCRQEFLIDTLLGNEYFLTVLPV